MKVLVYINNEKDKKGQFRSLITQLLNNCGIEFNFIHDEDFENDVSADALFVYGGDGTILDIVHYSYKTNTPILAINSGRLGFLAEFEENEIELAINLLLENKLIRDERLGFKTTIGGKTYVGLNELIVRKIFMQTDDKIVYLNIEVDDKTISKIKGDGILISTPTGSTAYALSVGNCILSPELDNFAIYPLAPHSIDKYCYIISSNKKCSVQIERDRPAGVFIDGEFISMLNKDEKITVSKLESKIIFLRKQNFDFYEKLKKVSN